MESLQHDQPDTPTIPAEPVRVPVSAFPRYRAWPETVQSLRHLIFDEDYNGLASFGVVERIPLSGRPRVLVNLPAFDRWIEAVRDGRVKVGKRRAAKARA